MHIIPIKMSLVRIVLFVPGQIYGNIHLNVNLMVLMVLCQHFLYESVQLLCGCTAVIQMITSDFNIGHWTP
jgi:hypothetical protein